MMQSSRYKDAAREIGVMDEKAIKEQEKIRLAHEKEELRRLKKEQKREELMKSGLFRTIYKIKHLFDDWHLDAIIGLIPYIRRYRINDCIISVHLILCFQSKIHSIDISRSEQLYD